MGYGGVVNAITDPFGIGNTAPKTPNPGKVGKDYLALIQAMAQGAPTIFNTEAQFKPQYGQLDLNNLESTIPSFTNILKTASPDAAGIVRSINPGQTDLLDALTRSATDELGQGSDLGPELTRLFQQSVRGSEAARGMGHGPSDVLDESVGLTKLGNDLWQQRRSNAASVATLDNNLETSPALNLMTQIPSFSEAISRGAGPSILPNNTTSDIFSTAYNARAAANINQANLDSSY